MLLAHGTFDVAAPGSRRHGRSGGPEGTRGGADEPGRGRRRRRRVGRRGRARPAGSSNPMCRRLPPRCSPPGGKRCSCPGRTAGERQRLARARSSWVPIFSGRRLEFRSPRQSRLSLCGGTLRVCGFPTGSLAVAVFGCVSLCVSFSNSVRHSAGLRHPRISISPLTSFVSFCPSLCKSLSFMGLCFSTGFYLCAGLRLR